ncbi:Dolichyl-monophosphooligosaccharide--protein glycotransferase AglB [uncultured archaeon]|nr:Dolichyl-monophosphooligosaccharide--protein glycotransferase AglB [uncultured archaeon]
MNEEGFNNLLKKNWSLFAVAGVFVLALYIRLLSLPLVQKYIPDIDIHLFYRMSVYILNNNFHMIAWDALRNYPFGLSTATEQPLPFYLPVIFYKIASIFSSLPYRSLVMYYPPIITALTAIPMYLIGKELKDKWTGIFSAFFFAVMPALLMRNSSGYIGKEPATLVFMMLSVYFFIRTMKKDSWLSAALMGMCLALVDAGWGGAKHLYVGYAILAFALLFANRHQKALMKNYIFITIAITLGAFITQGSYLEATHLMTYFTLLAIIARGAVERFNLVEKGSLKYFIPALSVIGLIIVLIASTFSSPIAGFLNTASHFLFFNKGVFGNTVAEYQRPDFGTFNSQFGAPYAAGVIPVLQPILLYIGSWVFAFIALIYLAYKSGNNPKWLHPVLVAAALLSFIMFVENPSDALQTIYIVSFFASVFLFAKAGQHEPALIAILLFTAILEFLSITQAGFLAGPYMAIFAGYFISEAISRIRNMDAVKNAKTLEEKINIYSVGAGGLIALVLVASLASGYALGSSLGPLYNDNWDGAMNFMKNNTSTDSVILSWWDYGYWFQAMGERASALDGGNNYYYGDQLAGRYFSGRMNESEQKDYLSHYGITHIIVDASMIGKYSAMTSIGTDSQEIDQYVPLGNPQQLQKSGKPILVFPLGSSAFYVSVNPNGTSIDTQIQQITFSTPRGDANLKYLCTEDGLVDLKPKDPAIDACLLVTKYGVFFPVDGTRGVPSTATGTSVFAKLFFFDGKGVDYVKKVYDNPEVKIYEVELPRQTREELLNWWKENVSKDDTFAYNSVQALKKFCISGNDIKTC